VLTRLDIKAEGEEGEDSGHRDAEEGGGGRRRGRRRQKEKEIGGGGGGDFSIPFQW